MRFIFKITNYTLSVPSIVVHNGSPTIPCSSVPEGSVKQVLSVVFILSLLYYFTQFVKEFCFIDYSEGGRFYKAQDELR